MRSSVDSGDALSRALRVARFPMILGIVVIHCFLPIEVGRDGVPTAAYGFMYLGSEVMARLCVPLFFAISGFLFFYKKERIDTAFFIRQWKKRLRTLLVPYMLWNLLAFLFLLLKSTPALSRFFAGMDGVDLSVGKFFLSFWEFSFSGAEAESKFFDPMHGPVDFPLWFIRDLMLLVLVTPLIYRLLKTTGWLLPGVLAVCFACGWWPAYCPGFSITGVLFFTLGSALAINRVNPLDVLWGRFGAWRATVALTIVYAALASADLLTADLPANLHIHAVGILAGVCWLMSVFGLFSIGGGDGSGLFASSSFFVYAFHGMLSSMVCKLAMLAIKPSGNFGWIACYIAAVAGLTLISVGVFAACRRVFPRLTAVLTGGRDV